MATYVITIGGVTKTIQSHSLHLPEEQNARNNIEFDVLSRAGTDRPALDDEVVVTENGTRVFGGNIIAVRETGHPNAFGGVQILNHVEAADFNALADRRYVNITIPNGTTLYTALNTYLLPYLTAFGVTLSASQVNPGPTLPELRFEWVVCSQALDDVAAFAGNWTRTIDYNKELRIYDPSGVSAPFNIAANDGNVIGDVTVEPTREQYATRVVVRFNEAARRAQAFLDGSFGGAAIADGNTVVIGSRTYTFQTTLTDVNGHVKVGATIGDSLDNLVAAIVGGAGAGSVYAASTTVNSQVEAFVFVTNALTVRALTAGAAGNTIGVSTTASIHWITEGAITTSTLALGADESLSNSVAVGAALGATTWEDVITAVTDSAATAASRGTQYLAQRNLTRKLVTYTTRRLGIRPGMTQTINLPRRNINNSFLVQKVDTFEGRLGVLHRTVTAIEGTAVQSSWRDTYKQWAAGSGTGTVVGGGGGETIVNTARPLIFLGASASEVVKSATPTWVPVGAVQIAIDTVARGTLAGTVTVRMRARDAGVTVQASLWNVSDNVSAGAGVVITNTAWQTDVFAVTLTAGTKLYELRVLPGTANAFVQAVGYLE